MTPEQDRSAQRLTTTTYSSPLNGCHQRIRAARRYLLKETEVILEIVMDIG